MTTKTIRIGGASGFWGESAMATPQLLSTQNLDYLVYDYLAEITMSIMARARAANPELGYARDFVSAVLKPNLREIDRQGVKVISNAGGINPGACGETIRKLVDELGLNLQVAIVTGDDLMPEIDQLASAGITEMFSGESFPSVDTIASVNAYLGATPIAAALAEGADIVVTGRVVDSAVTLGACMHEFGWTGTDLHQLAGGSLAGHLLECGPQATGGNFTDWELVADTLVNIGYPIAEIGFDGSCVITKPDDTGGAVTPFTVCEQMLYEIGDPQAYLLPDVTCDFSEVRFQQIAQDRVSVSGARGRPPPATYKVSATYADGFRGGQILLFYGFDAARKARQFGETAVTRASARLRAAHMADFLETSIELIGDESHYGSSRSITGSREVAIKIAAKHADKRALAMLFQDVIGSALGAPPGLSGFAGGRPKPSPVVRLFSFEYPRERIDVTIEVNSTNRAVPDQAGAGLDLTTIDRPDHPGPPAPTDGEQVTVPLIRLALGRSGDKGDKANIGIIARRPAYLPYIWHTITEQVVAERFSHFLKGGVDRYYLPGTNAINFVLHEVLGGGGIASLRNDPQGKGYAQILLDHPITIPQSILETG